MVALARKEKGRFGVYLVRKCVGKYIHPHCLLPRVVRVFLGALLQGASARMVTILLGVRLQDASARMGSTLPDALLLGALVRMGSSVPDALLLDASVRMGTILVVVALQALHNDTVLVGRVASVGILVPVERNSLPSLLSKWN